MMKENQVLTMVVLMAINMASTSLQASGAFEVYYNDTLVFSKLDTQIVPDAAYLIDRFNNFPATGMGEIDRY